MKTVLQRLLRQDDPPRIFASVVGSRPDGRYTVCDDIGRKITVDGAAGYLPGVMVVVQAGRIVGTGTRPPVRKTIKV